MKKRINPALLVLSILALANVLFVPLFDVWGGLFPRKPDDNFLEVVKMLLKNAGHNWNLWVVQITVFIFVPCVFILIFTLTGCRKLCAVSAGVGLLLWLKNIIQFIDQNKMSAVFDFDDCSISIGTWIAFFLFIAIFVVSLCSGHRNKESVHQSLTSTYTSGGLVKKNISSNFSIKFCPKCGGEIESGSNFCGKCGNNIYDENKTNNVEQ